MDIRESRKVTQITAAECLRQEPSMSAPPLVHLNLFYKGHETQLVQLGQWLQLSMSGTRNVVSEGKSMVEVGDGGDIPGAADQ